MPTQQSAANHTRYDPVFHFFLLPMSLLNVFAAIYVTVRHWPYGHLVHLWWVVMSVVFLFAVMKIRTYALGVQDRVIRLEERLRYASLLPASELPATERLTLRQIVALRFASDAELPALLKRAVTESLDAKTIKTAIVSWRADDQRI